ncbi:hypothetical protein OAS86_01375 [Gammaproteobacteria bacterium]|nr:hypothetical protein [Gammaproteobacteria bacterium]
MNSSSLLRTAVFMSILLAVLAAVWTALEAMGVSADYPPKFPVSVLARRADMLSGWPWLVLAAAAAMMAIISQRWLPLLLALVIWLVSINLVDGWEGGVLRPIISADPATSYYHDALTITDRSEWLATFNRDQAQLSLHGRTHPPWAVLIHALPGELTSIVWLKLLSGLAIPFALAWLAAGLSPNNPQTPRAVVALSLTPALTIYSLTSIDALIALLSILAFGGWTRYLQHGRWPMLALSIAMVMAANLFTFGALFWAALMLIECWRLRARDAGQRAWVVTGSTLLSAVLWWQFCIHALGYDHLQALRTASHLENPLGFYGVAEPLNYLLTRIEGSAEWILFLSLPLAALLWNTRTSLSDCIAGSAIVVLALMLLAGTWRTGETARACLFAYPLLMPWLIRHADALSRPLLALIAVQTVMMAVVGNYYW